MLEGEKENLQFLQVFFITSPLFFFYISYAPKDQSLRYPVNVDGHFLTEPVPELFQKHQLLTVPFMTGINNHEGGFVFSDVSFQCSWAFQTTDSA